MKGLRDLNREELILRVTSLTAENDALRDTLDHANSELKDLRRELTAQGRQLLDAERDLMVAEQGERRHW
jgi:hypothetical protein